MAVIVGNLINYFNSSYGKYRDIEEEVSTMLKTLYAPEVEKRGDSVEEVIDITELSKAEGLKVKNEIQLKKN